MDYLEVHHKPVYNLYNWMGMHTSLTPKRGGGLTLLLPDAKMVAELTKQVESEDAAKATDVLSGLIIQDYLGDAKAWADKQDDIPNLLGKRILVKNVSAGKVILEGGAELTLDALLAQLRSEGVSPENLPERLEIRAALPHGSGGKVAKQLLREEIRALLQLPAEK